MRGRENGLAHGLGRRAATGGGAGQRGRREAGLCRQRLRWLPRGPNLDKALEGKDAAFIEESIKDPNAEIAQGYGPNIMPQTYGSQLDSKAFADLVAFLQQK